MLKMNGVIELMLDGAVRRIDVEEVQCPMNCMKTRKASVPSGVSIELLKTGGDKCLKSLTTYLISCSKISYLRNGC